MTFGINATKVVVFVTETHRAGQQLYVTQIQRIEFLTDKATDLPDSLDGSANLLIQQR
jgi:hypothetical protein